MNDVYGWIFMIVLTLVLLRWGFGRSLLRLQYFYVVPLFFLLTLPGDICLVSGWEFSGETGIPVFDFFVGGFGEVFLPKEGAFQDYLEFSPNSGSTLFFVAAGYVWTFTAVPFYHFVWKRRGRRTEQPEQQPERPPQPPPEPQFPQLPLQPRRISAPVQVEEDIVEGEFEEIVVGETEDVRRRSTILLPPADYYEEEE